MGHFEELCALSATVEEKQRSIEAIIRREATRLVTFWKRWLELPSERWVDNEGNTHPYVATGYMDPVGEFTPSPIEGIPVRGDGTLMMELRTYVGANTKRPSSCVSVSLQVMSAGESGIDIAVAINNDRPIQVFVSGSDEYAWEAVAQSIKQHIQDEIKSSYPACLL